MSQHDIEVILTQHLASYLALPVFIVDPQGDLLFYNEHAEGILGQRFDETGRMPAEVWGAAFTPMDEDSNPIDMNNLPLVIAMRDKKPAHDRFFICGLDKVKRHIEVTAFPLIGQGKRYQGAVAMFWEVPD
jgi:hypothetical protein